jgi:predicted ATPase
MIKEIKIENFKSIESLNLELGRLNVFIGANGSGKSNILEGIAFGSAAGEDKLDKEFLANRGIRYADAKYFFNGFQKDNTKQITIRFDSNSRDQYPITYLLKNKNSSHSHWEIDVISAIMNDFEEYIRNTQVKGFEDKNYPSQLLDLYKKAEIFKKLGLEAIHRKILVRDEFEKFLIFAPENSYLRNFEEETAIEPLGIKGQGLFSHLVYFFKERPLLFQKINENLELLDWFDGFEIPNDLMFTEKRIKIKDRFLEEGLQYFDQRSANEGFLYLLFYLTLFISDETPKFFAIDNIDNAMNPKMGNELVYLLAKLAKEHNKQVILTTHNPSVLDGLDLSDDDQRLFVISRNKKGHTQAIRVPHRESEERLSYRFIRGSIGGLPKNF